jgi:hypothetical protein
MKTLKTILTLLSVSLFLSCGKVREAANVVEAVTNLEKTTQQSSDKMKERQERGDTLAIPYKDLQGYLPSSVSDFEKDGEPSGESVNAMGMSYSVANQMFSKGDSKINISLMDYNAAFGVLSMATTMLSSGYSVDNDTEHIGSVKFEQEGMKGWEDFKKKEKRGTVTVVINDRFLINIEASNIESTERLQEIVKSMDLKKLSEM